MFVSGKHLIFNFNNGITDTPKLFYRLPYDRLEKIEFLIHRYRKQQLFGEVTFTFRVLDYQVTHVIRFPNLTKIEQYLQQKFPSVLGNLIVDGKSEQYYEPTKKQPKAKCILMALGLLLVAVVLIAVPRLLDFNSLALTIVGVLLIVTAVLVFLAPYLYVQSLITGVIVSAVFMIMGICVLLLVIEISGMSPWDFVLQDVQILMATIFGIIGLCLFVYQMIIFIGKIHYKITSKSRG